MTTTYRFICSETAVLLGPYDDTDITAYNYGIRYAREVMGADSLCVMRAHDRQEATAKLRSTTTSEVR